MNLFNRKQRRAGLKEPRAVEAIQQEYQTLCAKIGQRQLQRSAMDKQDAEDGARINQLTQEFTASQAKAIKEAQEKVKAEAQSNAKDTK